MREILHISTRGGEYHVGVLTVCTLEVRKSGVGYIYHHLRLQDGFLVLLRFALGDYSRGYDGL